MSFRHLLTVNAILFLPFGVGFLIIPSMLLSLYGASPEPATALTAQLYGGLLIAIGLLCWLSRGVTDAQALRAMQLSFMIGYAINGIVHARGTVTGVLNALGWSAVLLYLLLTVGYAFHFFQGDIGRQE